MNTHRLRTHNIEAPASQGHAHLPPVMPHRSPSDPSASELRDFAEAATRLVTISATVLVIHLAALKYIFLAT
jgi:hypothetical protein